MSGSPPRWILLLICFLSVLDSPAQDYPPQGRGWRHIIFQYRSMPVDVLVKSAAGEEQQAKPLFFFCQGSLPKPLVIYDEKGMYSIFPFKTDSLEKYFHLVIVGKPGIPLRAKVPDLQPNFTVQDSAGINPKYYSDHNLPEYYVQRNLALVTYLRRQKWVSAQKLVVAGHSEGATVAALMSAGSSAITHLIFASGNPFGRIMSMLAQAREREAQNDSSQTAAAELEYWKYVLANRHSLGRENGDTPKATYAFSMPVTEILLRAGNNVLVTYGSRDPSALFNDYLQVESARRNKQNISFNCYQGLEHNFFGLHADGTANYSSFNWDRVALDWMQWIRARH